jgi:hypothetical protein
MFKKFFDWHDKWRAIIKPWGFLKDSKGKLFHLNRNEYYIGDSANDLWLKDYRGPRIILQRVCASQGARHYIETKNGEVLLDKLIVSLILSVYYLCIDWI